MAVSHHIVRNVIMSRREGKAAHVTRYQNIFDSHDFILEEKTTQV